MTPTTLPPFPTDDATLAAVEHALGARLADDQSLTGADFTLRTLLDVYAGSHGDDPHAELMAGGAIEVDSRETYHEHDVIAALIAEVRRLRGEES